MVGAVPNRTVFFHPDLIEAISELHITEEQRMSLKAKLILGAGVLAAVGIGIGLELHRLHRRILEELVAIRKQGEK